MEEGVHAFGGGAGTDALTDGGGALSDVIGGGWCVFRQCGAVEVGVLWGAAAGQESEDVGGTGEAVALAQVEGEGAGHVVGALAVEGFGPDVHEQGEFLRRAIASVEQGEFPQSLQEQSFHTDLPCRFPFRRP